MNFNNLISIIVCSTNIKLRNKLYQNIRATINCDFEFLVHDNTITKEGLCQVYNRLAHKAQGDFLCFVHEDVLVETSDWGNILIDKAQELNTGVIGFAGSRQFNGVPFWHNKNDLSYNFMQLSPSGELLSKFSASDEDDFSEVKVLDGMFLFCRKEIWSKHEFDESLFKQFHMYDMDFTFNVSNQYTNYVCNTVLVKHFSLGTINYDYYKQISLMYQKWQNSPNIDKFKNRVELIESVAYEMVNKNHISIRDSLSFFKKINLVTSLESYFTAVYFCLRFKLSLLKK